MSRIYPWIWTTIFPIVLAQPNHDFPNNHNINSSTSRTGPPTSNCTALGDDPYASAHVPCCAGLSECLGNYDGQNRWFYLCGAGCALSEYNLGRTGSG